MINFKPSNVSAPEQLPNAMTHESFMTKLRQQQLDETAKIVPVSILFHFCASIVIYILVVPSIQVQQLRLWQLMVMISAFVCLLTVNRWRAIAKSPEQVKRFIWYTALAGWSAAVCWSIPSLLFITQVPKDAGFIIYGVTLAVLAIGVVTLLRIPFAAIVFNSTMVMMLSASVYQHLQNQQLLVALLCLTFGLALNVIVMILHWSFSKSARADWKTDEQNKAITLLLSDFEHGTSDWLFETDQKGRLMSFSPSLAIVMKLENSSLIGKDFSELFAADEKLQALLAAEIDFANLIVPLGEHQFWNITAKPKFDDAQIFVGHNGVGRNITQQHVSDMRVREARDEAEKASAAKSQFLAVISHELRTPINAIVGFSEVLNEGQETLQPSHRKEYLETILESSKQLQGLINDILDATRVERGALKINDQDIDAAELLEAAVKICRDQANKSQITIVAHVAGDVNVVGDLTRLKQVLVNLITNAIKFSPAESVVNVDMRGDRDRNLIFSVRDAGIGIKPEDAERVFEPFVQLDEGSTRRFGGVGLGLSIARRIARLHGGEVTIQGQTGIGTYACLILPSSRVQWPALEKSNAAA